MRKVLVATPMYNSQCTSGYTASVVGLFKNYRMYKDLDIDFMYGTNEALITYARNMFANIFLKSDATHLLFIDADIMFNPEEVLKMMMTDKDIVCGIYPKKKIDWVRVKQLAMQNADAENLQGLANEYLFEPSENFEPDENGLVEIQRAGTGMMLIRRNVFETLKDKVNDFELVSPVQSNIEFEKDNKYKEFFFTSKNQKNIFLNEDFSFCNLWRENGGKVYGAPWVRLKHIGNHVYG